MLPSSVLDVRSNLSWTRCQMFAQFGTYVCLYAHSFALVSVFFVMDLSLTHCEFAGNPSCQFPESLLFLNTV